MNVKGLVTTVTKTLAPIVKKWGPIAVGAISGGIGAYGKLKAQAHIDSMDARIKDLEALVNKK